MILSDKFDKKSLNERDICSKYITPALESAGWDPQTQMREEVTFTDGRVTVRGKLTARGKKKRADYVLYLKPGIPLAVVEAKDNNHSVGDGMQQAKAYTDPACLDLPFSFSSNGDSFLLHDKTGTFDKPEVAIPLDQFPSPEDLWSRYKKWKGIGTKTEHQLEQDFHVDGSGKSPRYYQQNAINRTVEAIAKGQNRILMVMATGTGKTYTAFQIIWRLWKSKTKKRILFLADRNILVDQTKTNDFKPFGQAMTKIKNRKADKSYEIYLSLYQAMTGPEESDKVYKEFSQDFFDLIVIDECHRGSAKEDSAWREILTYFSSATQIGMTATPKETKDVSNIDYFGEAVYTYSLKQGIDDGFLAPYKVVRIDFDKDLGGYRPPAGKTDIDGILIPDRIYNGKDFDRTLVIAERTRLVAQTVTEFLQATNPYDKAIVFCEDIDHAERMRQELVNANPEEDAINARYVVRITGDNPEGKEQLDFFINPEERYPVIATTSKLMTTGVDAKTCKLIVLDQTIGSMTEFKQIIGRGTRIDENYGKLYFTIMDFKKATELFADPDFDGEPVQVYEPKEGESPVPPDGDGGDGTGEGEGDAPGGGVIIDTQPEPPGPKGGGREKIYVDGVEIKVIAERVQYYGPDGKLITESLRDYTKAKVSGKYTSLDKFLQHWNESDKKNAVVDELKEAGVLFEALKDKIGREYDAFDLVCHVAYGQPPLTRRERANNVQKRDYFTKYGDQARAVLAALLEKYANQGIAAIEKMDVLKVQPLDDIGTPVEIIKMFGGKEEYQQAIKQLQDALYEQAA